MQQDDFGPEVVTPFGGQSFPKWPPKGPKMVPKGVPKSLKNRLKNEGNIRLHFRWTFHRFLHQLYTNFGFKLHSNADTEEDRGQDVSDLGDDLEVDDVELDWTHAHAVTSWVEAKFNVSRTISAYTRARGGIPSLNATDCILLRSSTGISLRRMPKSWPSRLTSRTITCSCSATNFSTSEW